MNSRPMLFVILAACLPAALATASYYQSGPAPSAIAKTPAAVVVSTPSIPKPPAAPVTRLGGVIKELSKFDAYSENDQEELEGVQEPIVSYLSDFECECNADGECEDDEEDCESKDG
jgi:hypothetical protein